LSTEKGNIVLKKSLQFSKNMKKKFVFQRPVKKSVLKDLYDSKTAVLKLNRSSVTSSFFGINLIYQVLVLGG